jgi:hypothetical protein
MKKRLASSHGGRLYRTVSMGHVEWRVLWFPNGFTPSTTKPTYKFFSLLGNVESISYTDAHCLLSTTDLINPLRDAMDACDFNNFAISGHMYSLWKRGIIGKYLSTLTGTLFEPSTYLGLEQVGHSVKSSFWSPS